MTTVIFSVFIGMFVCIICLCVIIDSSNVKTYDVQQCQTWSDYQVIINHEGFGYVGMVRTCLTSSPNCTQEVTVYFPGTRYGGYLFASRANVIKAMHVETDDTSVACHVSGRWAATKMVDTSKWIFMALAGAIHFIMNLILLKDVMELWYDLEDSLDAAILSQIDQYHDMVLV